MHVQNTHQPSHLTTLLKLLLSQVLNLWLKGFDFIVCLNLRFKPIGLNLLLKPGPRALSTRNFRVAVLNAHVLGSVA